eukprot:465174_1
MHNLLSNFHAQPFGYVGNYNYNFEIEKKLRYACEENNYDEAKQALQEGANPDFNVQTPLCNKTYLFICAENGCDDIATLLIEYRADVNRRREFDLATSLHIAAENEHIEMCKCLIRNGADINCRDKRGCYPIMEAAQCGSIKIIKCLIEHNADVNVEDRERHTALSYCLDFISNEKPKYLECAMLLIRNGANPHYQGKYTKKSLLHHLSTNGNMELIKELINEYKFCVESMITVLDSKDKTPLDYAKEHNNLDIIEYLNNYKHRVSNQLEIPCCIL